MRPLAAMLAAVLVLGMGPWPTASRAAAPAESDWPMLAHDPAQSGATAAEIRPPFQRKWYRLFPDEGLMAGVQPVVAGGKVFVGTMGGALHAMDAATGRDAWLFQAGGPILHTAAVAGGKVFFGAMDGKVYAVGADDGRPAWSVRTGSAVWNSPLVHEGVVVIGSRDGKLYALDAAQGEVRWEAPTGGPLVSSPALDAKAGRVYVGSEDMHVYAFNLADGKPAWRSEKLPGVSFRGYHPVVAPDGSVMIGVTPAASLDAFQPVLLDMVKEIFGDFASWRHTKEENARLREENFRKMAEPGNTKAQLEYLRKRLADQPALQTFFVLDPATGRQKFVAPMVYAESMNGTCAPPLVTPDGKVIVKFQALLRSRYEHYSPFLNVGRLDTSTGHITPIMDPSRTYGWHDSLLLVHDEQCQLVAAGRVLINTHQDNVNAMDLDTLTGYGEPFCRSVHEPQPGEALGIWALLVRGRPLPDGKEWLARGTAVYGGGSVIDVPVSVAGDSFYYVPTHEINAGAAVIACRMDPGGPGIREAKTPAAELPDDEWRKIRDGRWDWDTLAMPRLDHVLKAMPLKVPGTAQQPLRQEAEAAVAKIPDADLDRYVWEAPAALPPDGSAPADLKADLAAKVRELIAQPWRPLVFPSGKHPTEAYRFFTEPTETLLVLARAYPHLDKDLQGAVRGYVAKMSAPGGPLDGPTGQRTFRPDDGAVRSAYDVAPEAMMHVMDDLTRSDLARLYPLWLWAHTTGDWGRIERDWPRLRGLASQAPNKMEEDCRNAHLAGLIAYCRLAARMKDEASLATGLAKAREAMRERLTYELAHTRGGLIGLVPTSRAVFARWRNLTPEVSRLCAAYAKPIHEHLMQVYVDYHRPTWPLAWNVELMWRNESPFALPTMSAEIFAARAMILGEPPETLRGFLDLPWCKADLLYIGKLTGCLDASGKTPWQDVRK